MSGGSGLIAEFTEIGRGKWTVMEIVGTFGNVQSASIKQNIVVTTVLTAEQI